MTKYSVERPCMKTSLICESETDLKHMLDIVSAYAVYWRYELNTLKSAVLVIGIPESITEMVCIRRDNT